MFDRLQFGRLTNARRARPRRFRLLNAHLEEYLSENDVKSRFRFGRDSINYLADLLSDDLARNTAFQHALRVHGRLSFDQKFCGEFPKISMGKWNGLFPVWKTITVRLEFFNDF